MFAVVSVVLLQVILSSYYWIADPALSVALAPTWELPAIALLLVVWAAIGAPRWSGRVLVIALSIVVFAYFLLGLGQGFARHEFGYDVVLSLHVSYVPELFRMMYDAEPLHWFIIYCTLLGLGVLLLAFVIYGAVRHLYAFSLVGRRRQLGLAVGVTAGVLLGGLVLGTSGPVTTEAYRQIDLAVNLKDRINATAHKLDMEAAGLRRMNPFRQGAEQPTILVFVEHRTVRRCSPTARSPSSSPGWRSRVRSWRGAQLRIASKEMIAPVFGGSSWLAGVSLLCGLRIHHQRLFEALFASGVRCAPGISTRWATGP